MSRFLKENSEFAGDEFAAEYVKYTEAKMCVEAFCINHAIDQKRFKELERGMFAAAEKRMRAAMHGFGTNVKRPRKMRFFAVSDETRMFMDENNLTINQIMGIDEKYVVALG